MAHLGTFNSPTPDPSTLNRAQRRRLAKHGSQRQGATPQFEDRLEAARRERDRIEKKKEERAAREKSRRMGRIFD